MHCGVQVRGSREICPLCNSILQGRTQEEESYPNIGLQRRRWKRIYLIIAYFMCLVEMGLVLLNYFCFPRVRWSVISGVAILYVLFSLRDLPNPGKSHIRKLYFQAMAVFLLLVAIDAALGFAGWSICYGLPCILLSFDFIIFLCMMINFANWQNYVTIQICMLCVSFLYLGLALKGLVGSRILAWVTCGICLLFWTTTMVLGGSKAENEVMRKFHL
jgi:hypothetical protein